MATATKMTQKISIRSIGINNPLINNIIIKQKALKSVLDQLALTIH